MVALGAKDVQNEDDIQGNARPLPGRYHVVVKDVDESMEKFDKVIVEFEVLAGTTPGQEGRTVSEFFAITEKALPRLQRLAIVLGLLNPGDEEKEIEFFNAMGRQLVIEIEENQYEKDGKTVNGVRVGFLGFWSIGNDAVSDVPKDADALKLGGESTSAQSQSSPQTQQPEMAGAATDGSSGDKWDDL